MKKLSFLTMALAGLTLCSCSKDDNSVKSEQAKDAKILISFTSGINTKVIGAATDLADQKINDVSIFVFQESGINDVPRTYVASATLEDDNVVISATTAANRVYVVANIGDEAAHTSMFSSVVNETTLLALAKDRLLDIANIGATDVLMTGKGDVAAFSDNAASVQINLAFPLSKIKLIVKDNRYNNKTVAEVTADGHISIVDNKVILLNAGKSIKFFSTDLGLDQAVQTTFYTGRGGEAEYDPYFSNDDASTTWLTGNDGNGNTQSTNNTITHHFYTAANNGDNALTPTILAIQSTRTTHVSGVPVTTTVYYPIQFTADDTPNSETLKPGKSYEVTLTLNGDISGGDGSGVIDPMLPVVNGSINVAINVAMWIPVGIDKEFE